LADTDTDADADAGRPCDSEPDPESVARAVCLRLLTAAPHSRAQLAEALRRRRVPDPAAEAVLDRLTEVGLVDDAALATAWVQSRHRGRGLARRALAAELRQRGVEAETVATAVATLDVGDELQMARNLVARRLPATAGLPNQVRARRLAGLLARRGYPGAMAGQVVREALATAGRGREGGDEAVGYDED